MLELPHTVIGATIASKIPNPLISLPLAFLSHFVLDLVPHWNPDLYTEAKNNHISPRSKLIILGDVLLSLAFGFGVAYQALPNLRQAAVVILASFLAVVLDVVEGFYFFLGIRHPLLLDLIKFQHRHQKKVPLISGLLTQVVTILLSLYILRS